MRCFSTLLFAALLALAACSLFAGDTVMPPKTAKKPVTDIYHGVKVVDDYRWLEKTGDAEVKQWVELQNKASRARLDASKALSPLRKRLTDLMSAAGPSYSSLQYRKGFLFGLKKQPPLNQPMLVVMISQDQPETASVILDPNKLDPKGTTAIDFFVPSRDGKLVAVSLSEGGSEEGTLYVFETSSGKKLPDTITRVSFPTAGGDAVWDATNTGFYYTRYPRGAERPKEDLNSYQQVYYHKLGDDPAKDEYVIGKDFPRIAENFLDTSADGKHLLVTTQNGDGGEFMHHLRGPDGKWHKLTSFADQISAPAFGVAGDDALYLLSRKDAPLGKILRMPLDQPDMAKAKVVVPQSDVAIDGLRFASNRLVTGFTPAMSGIYVADVDGGPSRLRFVKRDGETTIVPLPPVASVEDVVFVTGDRVLIQIETFLQGPAWYRYGVNKDTLETTKLVSKSPADFSDCEVVREFATSKDGTKVPMSVLRKKGVKLDGTNPTLLTGYGGYGISQTPRFRAATRVWLEQGGVFVVANIRGGGEYGEAWHKAAQLTKRQNAYDDFAACAQRLIALKYTTPAHLAIEGGSNGGLLMGAMITQHPELFRAVVGHVGIYDMLRAELHPNGAFNVTEYGTVKNKEQFDALYAYSPFHRVKDGTAYPAVFLLTGINDGRVDPANSLRMAARLQAATSSKQPIMLLVNFGSGHGIGDGLNTAIERQADVYAFLLDQLGMSYKVPQGAAQWQTQTIATKSDFRGLSVVNANVAWVSGTKGTYGRTIDGGKTWSVGIVPGAEKLDFRDVEAFGENIAYLLSIGAGESSRIYKTLDGGKTWALQFKNADPAAFFDALAFWDEKNGIALGDPVKGVFQLIVTADGGANWKPLAAKNLPPALPGDGAFAASGTCLVTHGKDDVWFVTGGASKARVFHSTDRGQTWAVSETPIMAGIASAGIFSIAFRDKNNGMIVGGNYSKPNESGATAAITSDGGKTWKLLDKKLPFRSGVAWAKDRWVAVGTSGSHVSLDDGATWKELDKGNYNSVGFTATGEGWAAGPKGRIAKFAK